MTHRRKGVKCHPAGNAIIYKSPIWRLLIHLPGGVEGLSDRTLQHSQRGLDSTVHIVLKVKHKGHFRTVSEMLSMCNSWHNRWLPPKKQTNYQMPEMTRVRIGTRRHASMPTTQYHLVASSFFTVDAKSWHQKFSHRDFKALTMRWCVSEFDIYPYFEQMQSPDWQAGSGALLSSELGHTVEQRQTMVKQMTWEKDRFISTGHKTIC